MKDWMTKNKVAIVIGISIIAVIIIYFILRKKTNVLVNVPKVKVPDMLKVLPGMTGLTGITRSRAATAPVVEKKATKAELQRQLDECEKNTKNIRLPVGAVHPCAALRDLVANTESSFAGPFTKTNGLNMMDVAMGNDGLALLEDRNRRAGGESSYMITGCPPGLLPNPTTGICGKSMSWSGTPKGLF